jgi:hypothetical protein
MKSKFGPILLSLALFFSAVGASTAVSVVDADPATATEFSHLCGKNHWWKNSSTLYLATGEYLTIPPAGGYFKRFAVYHYDGTWYGFTLKWNTIVQCGYYT